MEGLTDGWAIGYWNIEVAVGGVYEIELWRWPEESGLPLNAGYAPDFTRGARGQRPIVGDNVQLAGKNYTIDSQPDDTSVVFRIRLEPGKHRLQTNLLGNRDQTICSAMYTKITRLPDANAADLTVPSERIPRPGVRPGPVVLAEPVTLREDDVLMADFEGDSFDAWVAVGEAFASGPVLAGQRVVGHEGERVLDTFIGNGFSEQPTGTLTSPAFEIDRDLAGRRVGGDMG